MAKYKAWIVIQKRDAEIEGVLRYLGYPPVSLDTRERISLRRVDNSVEFCVANPTKVLDRIPNQGQVLRAITSAPHDDVEFFHNRILQSGSTRFRIVCDSQLETHDDSPYGCRFLSIRNDSIGVANSPDPWQPIKEIEPEEPNLWLLPESVELTEEQVAYCFGRGAAAELLTESFMLPPVRILEDFPEAEQFKSPEIPAPLGTYFNESLIDLRRSVIRLLGRTNALADADASTGLNQIPFGSDLERLANPLYEPTACTMMRLCDEPLLRDVFLDGGALHLIGHEGTPTRIVLQVITSGLGAEDFRSRFILNPDQVVGPKWARDLARAVRSDIMSLLPNNGLELSKAERKNSWDLQAFTGETNHTGGSGGTWRFLNALRDRLYAGSAPADTFWERVLYPSQGKAGRPDPDHDLAERLFMDQAWRCPWEYRHLTFDPWRDTLRQILAKEFTGQSLSAEGRVDLWNTAQRTTNFRYHIGPYREIEETFFLRYAGPHDPDSVLMWRLLLPWRSIVSARTIYLDRPTRSRLNGTFVLA